MLHGVLPALAHAHQAFVVRPFCFIYPIMSLLNSGTTENKACKNTTQTPMYAREITYKIAPTLTVSNV